MSLNCVSLILCVHDVLLYDLPLSLSLLLLLSVDVISKVD